MTRDLFDRRIAACNACALACERCATACLREQDCASMRTCIALDLDCASACRFAAALMGRDSVHAAQACRLCADICSACAGECEKHPHAHCQACAAACRDCAQECRAMAAG